MNVGKFVGGSILTASLILGGIFPIISKASSELEIETSKAIIDLSFDEEISSVQVPLDNEKLSLSTATVSATASSNPVVTSNVKRFLIPPLISATATSESTVKEDYIEAKVRAYYDTGGLMGTGVDSATKATYAGAQYSAGTKWVSKAYGSHVYKLSGYKDVYHETSTD